MRSRFIALVCLLLAGCDEPTVITHVDKLPHMSRADLLHMQETDGIPVEFHGRPFESPDPDVLAAAMKPPAGGSQSVRFFAAPPGSRTGWRLVLHFNPQGGVPNAVHDCRRTAEAQTAGIAKGRFSVNVTFCEGDEWQAHGFLKVHDIDEGDTEAFSRAMRQLFTVIFAENMDPDR